MRYTCFIRPNYHSHAGVVLFFTTVDAQPVQVARCQTSGCELLLMCLCGLFGRPQSYPRLIRRVIIVASGARFKVRLACGPREVIIVISIRFFTFLGCIAHMFNKFS